MKNGISRALRIGSAGALLGSGIAIVLMTAPQGSEGLQSDQSRTAEPFMVTVDTVELRMACPPGIVDPSDMEKVLEVPAVWASSGAAATPLAGSGSMLDPGEISSSDDLPSALSVAGTAAGDYRSLVAGSCQITRPQVALVGGSTAVGEESVLTIANPSAKAVEVSVAAFGAGGPLDLPSQQLIVPAKSSASWLPATWFPGEDRLALVLTGNGEGLAAWLQSSGRDGEVPLGVGVLGGRSMEATNVFPGVSERHGTPVLRILNPTDDALAVRVSTTSDKGLVDLPGTGSLVVDAGAVFELELGGIGGDPIGVVLSADKPFSASLSYQTVGELDPVVKDQKVQSRTLVAPAVETDKVAIPTSGDIAKLLPKGGFSSAESALTVVNVGGKAVTAGGRKIPAGGSFTWKGKALDQLEGSVSSDGPVYVALSLSAKTPLGAVSSVTDLGFGGISDVSRTVFVTP